ncbi:MAG TPA: hypothetical protein VI522_01195, partial [Gammaproteobacteria bacterium]|nr:hypothetical protein [Gammaproteobacteria bacterium]
ALAANISTNLSNNTNTGNDMPTNVTTRAAPVIRPQQQPAVIVPPAEAAFDNNNNEFEPPPLSSSPTLTRQWSIHKNAKMQIKEVCNTDEFDILMPPKSLLTPLRESKTIPQSHHSLPSAAPRNAFAN